MIKDSGGKRTEFDTGAVRDIQKSKGRCDLMPLDIVSELIEHLYSDDCYLSKILSAISDFQSTGDRKYLFTALTYFLVEADREWHDMLLDVSIHFEEGAEKYGECNWQKGIPTKSYINSAIRHLFKWYRGDDDERHDRAFVWNILCCAWTVKNKPKLNDYGTQIINESNKCQEEMKIKTKFACPECGTALE